MTILNVGDTVRGIARWNHDWEGTVIEIASDPYCEMAVIKYNNYPRPCRHFRIGSEEIVKIDKTEPLIDMGDLI